MEKKIEPNSLDLMQELAGVAFTNPDERITVATAHMMLQIAIKRTKEFSTQETKPLKERIDELEGALRYVRDGWIKDRPANEFVMDRINRALKPKQ